MITSRLFFIFLAFATVNTAGQKAQPAEQQNKKGSELAKCEKLLLDSINPKQTDAQVMKFMSDKVKLVFGERIGKLPPAKNLAEFVENVFRRPLEELFGVKKISESELSKEIDKILEEHMNQNSSIDFKQMFSKIKDIYVRSSFEDCRESYDLAPLEKISKLAEVRVKSMSVDQALEYNKDLEAEMKLFSKDLDATKHELTTFVCNCRGTPLVRALQEKPLELMNDFNPQKYNANDQVSLNLFLERMKILNKLFFETAHTTKFADKNYDKNALYVSYASGLSDSATESDGSESDESLEKFRKVKLQVTQHAMKELKKYVPHESLSEALVAAFQQSIETVYGNGLSYSFFASFTCQEKCQLDFKNHKLRSQLQLIGLVHQLIEAAEENQEEGDQESEEEKPLPPLDEFYLDQMIDNYVEVFDFTPRVSQVLEQYKDLFSFGFVFSALEKSGQVAVDTFAIFLEEISSEGELHDGPHDFDKFLDRNAEQNYLKGFYHALKIWNLIGFANNKELDYKFEWKATARTEESFKEEEGLETEPHIEKGLKKVDKHCAQGNCNARIIYQLIEVTETNYEVAALDVKKAEVEYEEVVAKDQRMSIKLKLEKGFLYQLIDCKQAEPKVINISDYRFVVIENGVSRETNEKGFHDAIEECNRPKFKIIKHYFANDPKNCKPEIEEVPVHDEPKPENAHEYYFGQKNGGLLRKNKQEFEQAVEDCIHPPTYVVRTHTVDYCDFDTSETIHKGRPKPSQELDIYREVITNENKEVIDTLPLTKDSYDEIKRDCETPKLVYSTKITYDDYDCNVLDEQKTSYKRKLPPKVEPFYYFLKTDKGTKPMDIEEFNKWKEECDHPPKIYADVLIINDDDCTFKSEKEEYSRRFPKGISSKRYAKVFFNKETSKQEKIYLTKEEYLAIEESCLNPIEIMTFINTVKNVCQFEVTKKPYKRRLPDGVEKESYFEMTDEAEPKQIKLTDKQFQEIQKECDDVIVVARTIYINDENCDEQTKTKEYKRKLPYNVPEVSHVLIYLDENDVEKQKPLTPSEYELVYLDCKNPKILEVTFHYLDKDCQYSENKKKYERKLPKGFKVDMYYTEENGPSEKVDQTSFNNFNKKCDERVFYTTVWLFDDDCHFDSRKIEHRRSLPKDIPLESYAFITFNDEKKPVESPSDKTAYDKMKYDCEHPKILTSTTYIADDDECLFNVRMKSYERKLPVGVEPEYWAVIVDKVETKSDEAGYKKIKESCDHPITVLSYTHFIDDDTCEKKDIEAPYKRRLPKDIKEHNYVVTSHGTTISDMEEEYQKVKKSCDDPITVYSHEHTINDDDCHKDVKDVPHKRRLPPGVEENSYFIKKGTSTEKALYEAYHEVEESCDHPIKVYSHIHTINDDTCEKKVDDIEHSRRLPPDVKENTYFIIKGKETTDATPTEYQAVEQSCDHPIIIKVTNYIISNCEYFTEDKEYSRRLPPKVDEVNYYSEELDGSRGTLTFDQYNAMKKKCDESKPITMIDTFKNTKDVYILDKCKVSLYLPLGKIGPDGKRQVVGVDFLIIKGKKIHEVDQETFVLAQQQCSFHGAADEDVYPDATAIPEHIVTKYTLTEECLDDISEEKFAGQKPDDFKSVTWFVRLSAFGAIVDQPLTSQAEYNEEKVKCEASKRQNRIPETPRRLNQIKMIRGALPEEELDQMTEAPEFVDHLDRLRTLIDVANPEDLTDADLNEYLKKKPMVYDPVNDEYIRITFVQVARQNSDCLKQFEL